MSYKIHTTEVDPLVLAENLLLAVRNGQAGEEWIRGLAMLGATLLSEGLFDDTRKMAFWINLYNAFNLIQMRGRPIKSRLGLLRHFFHRGIHVAGRRLSLNDIEHRILRQSRRWWGHGKWHRWEAGAWERKARVADFDPRIHFALNCGAVSCPPIRFYDHLGISQQLEVATRAYLNDVEFHADHIGLPGLLEMYLHDFGGEAGLRSFLQGYFPGQSVMQLPLRFKKFDKREHLDAFVD